jgi:hypothetical protein
VILSVVEGNWRSKSQIKSTSTGAGIMLFAAITSSCSMPSWIAFQGFQVAEDIFAVLDENAV